MIDGVSDGSNDGNKVGFAVLAFSGRKRLGACVGVSDGVSEGVSEGVRLGVTEDDAGGIIGTGDGNNVGVELGRSDG